MSATLTDNVDNQEDALSTDFQGGDDSVPLVNGASAAEGDELCSAAVPVDDGDVRGVQFEGDEADQREGATASLKEHKKRKRKSSSRSRRSGHGGSQTLIQGIQKVVSRLSLEGSISEMEALSQNYENVVLSADAESPVIYTDSVETQRRSHSNDYFIVIVLMLLFLPFGGCIPLILLFMSNRAKRRGHYRKSIRYLRYAVKCSSAVFVFGTALVIVVIIVAIVTAVETSTQSSPA